MTTEQQYNNSFPNNCVVKIHKETISRMNLEKQLEGNLTAFFAIVGCLTPEIKEAIYKIPDNKNALSRCAYGAGTICLYNTYKTLKGMYDDRCK